MKNEHDFVPIVNYTFGSCRFNHGSCVYDFNMHDVALIGVNDRNYKKDNGYNNTIIRGTEENIYHKNFAIFGNKVYDIVRECKLT